MKNKNFFILLPLLVGMGVLAGCTFSDNQKMQEKPAMETSHSVQKMSEPSDSMSEKNMSGEMFSYSDEQVKKSLGEGKTVILAFAADWCPSCQALEKDIMKNITKIPHNMVLLRVNFDTEKDLVKQYGVTSQHTFVQIDKNEKLLKKWSGSPTLAALVASVQK